MSLLCSRLRALADHWMPCLLLKIDQKSIIEREILAQGWEILAEDGRKSHSLRCSGRTEMVCLPGQLSGGF